MATIVCRHCGNPNPAGKRFCGDCGTPLEAPVDKERRLITVLFADLVDSTALGEMLDPETVDEVVGSVQQALAGVIERYGGRIAKVLGDGVMALFGAPIAHEDDAERAILAGWEMQQALVSLNRRRPAGIPVLALRVGITSGEVVAGMTDGRYDVAGDAANTAARLQEAAGAGGVLVGAETMRLAYRRIDFESPRELQLKGKAGTLTAFPVRRPRERLIERWEMHPGSASRFQASASRFQAVAPLIGRDRELAVLEAAWQRSRLGSGQLVTLIGEAGIGKSRLAGEWIDRLSASSDLHVLRARSLSYGRQVSLWLIADLLRHLAGIEEQNSPADARRQLETTVAVSLDSIDAETREPIVQVLSETLGDDREAPVRADAQSRRRLLVRGLHLVLEALCRQAPTVLLLEDLHWLDDASTDVLAALLAGISDVPVLVVTTQRPGWTPPWQDWDWPQTLQLAPLGEGDTARLADAVLTGSRLSPELHGYVLDRTGGNPFFIEELLRSLHETGDLEVRNDGLQLILGAAERMPVTVTEVVLARLDRLEGAGRAVAQVGSVIGRTFAHRLLAAVTESPAPDLAEALTVLQLADVVALWPAPETEYAFRHATIRDVAYNTLLQRRRQALHAATARALIALYGAGQTTEIIAYHFARTEEHAEAARWLERAGDRAAQVYANDTAIGHYEEARKRLDSIDAGAESTAELDEKRASVLIVAGRYDQAIALLEQAVSAFRLVGSVDAEARTLARIGEAQYHRGSYDQGIEHLTAFLDRAVALSPTRRSLLFGALALLYFAAGRYAEQLDAARQAAQLARETDDSGLQARTTVDLGLAWLAAGRRGDALATLEAALPLAEEANDLESRARALDNLSNVHYFQGEFDASREYLQQGLAVAERMGDPALIGHMLFMLGTNCWWTGEWSTARSYLERCRAAIHGVDQSRISALPLYGLGQVSLHAGDWDDATTYLEESGRLAEASGNLPILKWVYRSLAELALWQGRAEQAMALLEPLLQRPGLEQTATVLSMLAQAQLAEGHGEEAARTAAEALEGATAEGDCIDLCEALRASALVALQQHHWDEAVNWLDQGIALTQRMNYPYGEARFLAAYGRLSPTYHPMEDIRHRLEDALAKFQRLGARRDAEWTQEQIRQLDTAASTGGPLSSH